MFEVRPYPEFSWSITRQRLLESCPRAYYYRYYLAHNGWLSRAPSESKLAYRLSKLTSLDALVGQQMDERARELEAAARSGGPLPTATELEQRTRVLLREAWRSSLEQAAFEDRPKDHIMLRSFYLDGRPPSQTETDRLNGKLSVCHEHLVNAPHWERLRACAQDGYVLIPAFAHFFLGDIKAFAAGDLAYVHEGTVHFIDWKTGRPGDDDRLQVALAACSLLAGDQSLPGRPITATLYYLFEGREERVLLPEDLQAFAAEMIAIGVKKMRSYLRDIESNAPLEIGEFPRKDSGHCRSCNFTHLCPRPI